MSDGQMIRRHRVRLSTQIDADTDARVRRTLHGLARDGYQVTLADAVTQALEAWVTATVDELHDGREYPAPGGRIGLRPGRPLGPGAGQGQ